MLGLTSAVKLALFACGQQRLIHKVGLFMLKTEGIVDGLKQEETLRLMFKLTPQKAIQFTQVQHCNHLQVTF